MFTQVAVVPLDPGAVPVEDLLPIVAAIQVQVQRDLGPAWGLQAGVSAFRSLEQVPQGTWPVAVTDRADLPVDGFHFVMNGLPFGIVGDIQNLSVVLSHEISEMLVDPFGQRTIAGPALPPSVEADPGAGTDATPESAAPETTVDYLVEVCDVCEGETYQINGVAVSDFVVPGYYDMTRVRSRGYSFTGAVSAPRQVCTGGYISWREPFPSDSVYQAFGLPADIPGDLPVLTAKSVTNPGANAAGSATTKALVPALQVLELPNSPTRAWRELIAGLARQLPAAAPQSQPSNRGGLFANTFRSNTDALLEAMQHEQPPPSIPEILDAIENPNAPKTLGQTPLDGLQPTNNPDRRDKIINYLQQQESLSGIFGPDIGSDFAMWMFMIMP